MLKDLTAVFKNRWPEMLLIIGFTAIAIFLTEQLNSAAPNAKTPVPMTMTQTTSFLYSIVIMIFLVFAMILHLGFIATLNVNHAEPHDPAILIKIGRIFFWRTIRFQVLIGLAYLALAILFFSPIKFIFFPSKSLEDIPQWSANTASVIALAALVKPVLLITPIMIYKNLMVLPAVKILSACRLSEIKILPLIFIGSILIIGAITTLEEKMPSSNTIFNIIYATKSIITAVTALLTGIIAMWFVAGKRFGALQEVPEETTELEEEA
ncbi:MAG: hypothetical protein K9M75_05790 [Phycisphaerae bacterium]|nr:hypothetical protein [Phycisphaerae bacterium]